MKQNAAILSKDRVKKAISSCNEIISWLSETDFSSCIKYKQLNEAISSLITTKCLFAYVYTELDKYGAISEVIDTSSETYCKYTLAAALVFSEPIAMKEFLNNLSVKWNNNIVNSIIRLTTSKDTIIAEHLNNEIIYIYESIREITSS